METQLAFSATEYRRRFDAVLALAAERNLDYLIIHKPEQTCWISGFNPTGVFYQNQLQINPRTGEVMILTHRLERDIAAESTWVEDRVLWTHHGQDPLEIGAERARTHLPEGRTARLGMTLGDYYLKVRDFQKFTKLLGDVDVVDVTDAIDDLMLVKSDEEIAVIREASAIADAGYDAAIEAIRPGVREWDVNAAIQFALATHGGEYPAFPTLVSSGERTGPLHNLPSNRVLQAGDAVFLVIPGVRHRYNVNLERTVFVEEAPPLGREIYAVAEAAFHAGLALTRPGTPVGDIDRATLEVKKEKGFLQYNPGTRAGFGVGLSYPPIWISTLSILDGDPHILAPGYVFSLEPHIQGYHDWSITVGNIILVTADGYEELLRAPTTLVEVRH